MFASKLTSKGESQYLEQLISKIPYFNINYYIPEIYTDYSKIVICANRYDIDDKDTDFIVTGYDLNGNIYQYKLHDNPGYEVIVLGVNERIKNLQYYQSNEYSKIMGDGQTLNILGIRLENATDFLNGADVTGIMLFASKDPYTGDLTDIQRIKTVQYPSNAFEEKRNYYNEARATLFAFNPEALKQNIYVYFYHDDWGLFSNAIKIPVTITRDNQTITKYIAFTNTFMGTKWHCSSEDDKLFDFYMNYQDATPTKYYTPVGLLLIGH